jgi:DhnA family fructose-bisphosphate aldolase class Ia
MSFPKRRMHHVFGRDGRVVAVAMDHSRNGVARGLERPRDLVRQIVEGGADAILATIGLAQMVADELGGRGLILALDSEGPIADYGVDLALRYGADAVELKVFPGSPKESKMADLRRLAAGCRAWGMPLLGESIPVSFQETSAHTVERVGDACRCAVEAGADFVKAHYIGPADAYRSRVVGPCGSPLLVLGGAARGEPREALQMAADALEAGASGVVFGRNVLTSPRPDRMVAALVELVHGGATVEAAARELLVPV